MKISESNKTKIQRNSQILFLVLAWMFPLLMAFHVFFEGRELFLNKGVGAEPTIFIPIYVSMSVLMYFFGSAGWIPKPYKKGTLALVVVSILQNYTVDGSIGAIYAVFFLATFIVSLYLVWGSYHFVLRAKLVKSL